MNIGEIVSTLEELVVRVTVLEKAVATLKNQVQTSNDSDFQLENHSEV